MRCKNCGELEPFQFKTVALPKRGKLLTFTKVYNLPAEYEVATLGLGIVELENGIRVTGQVELDDPKIGMDVVGVVDIVRQETYDSFWGFIFRAA
jgi:hypothetical protein